MELGTPTNLLVEEWCNISLNPNEINVPPEGSFQPVATRIKFPSPTYLEGGKEYAIVILAPGSVKYRMFTAVFGEKLMTILPYQMFRKLHMVSSILVDHYLNLRTEPFGLQANMKT